GPQDTGAQDANSARKLVVAKTLNKLDWANSQLGPGDVPHEIKKLKGQSGPELQVHGSGNMIQTLLKNALIDEFRLKIFPITPGDGKRLFAEGAIPAGFKLIDCKTSTRGVIVYNYQREGEVKTGSFAQQRP